MLLISNIAYFMNREMKLDPKTGHILNDSEAMKLWGSLRRKRTGQSQQKIRFDHPATARSNFTVRHTVAS